MLEELKKSMLEAMNIAKALLVNEYKGQGHVNTGRLIESIEISITETGSKVIGELSLNNYALYLEKKTPPSRIPYRRGSGAKTSQFISKLQEYWQTKGLSEKEALGAAFATATIQKREGRPTVRSYSFSTNGRRTAAIQTAFSAKNLAPVEEIFLSQELIAKYQSGVVGASLNRVKN